MGEPGEPDAAGTEAGEQLEPERAPGGGHLRGPRAGGVRRLHPRQRTAARARTRTGRAGPSGTAPTTARPGVPSKRTWSSRGESSERVEHRRPEPRTEVQHLAWTRAPAAAGGTRSGSSSRRPRRRPRARCRRLSSPARRSSTASPRAVLPVSEAGRVAASFTTRRSPGRSSSGRASSERSTRVPRRGSTWRRRSDATSVSDRRLIARACSHGGLPQQLAARAPRPLRGGGATRGRPRASPGDASGCPSLPGPR